MSPTIRSSLLAVAIALTLCSCPETQVPRDFGTSPLKLKTDEWEGTWSEPGSNEKLVFTVTSADQGELTVKDKNNPILVAVRQITNSDSSKDLAFLIHFDKEKADFGSVNLIRRPEKGVFCLWGLKNDVVEEAVRSGELKGELKAVKKTDNEAEHSHVRLAADSANYDKLMDARYWNWTEPGFFIRAP